MWWWMLLAGERRISQVAACCLDLFGSVLYFHDFSWDEGKNLSFLWSALFGRSPPSGVHMSFLKCSFFLGDFG